MRVLQGIGSAMMVPVGRMVVLSQTEKQDLIKVTAYIVWPALIAPVIAPLAFINCRLRHPGLSRDPVDRHPRVAIIARQAKHGIGDILIRLRNTPPIVRGRAEFVSCAPA